MMGQMPKVSSWPEIMKIWGPRSYQEIWITELESTSQNDPHEDETQNEQTFLQLAEEIEPMSDVSDHYVRAEILLSKDMRWQKGWCRVMTPVET